MSVSPKGAAVLGQLGERLVAQWLQQQGWCIVSQGWTTRWGELDIVAHGGGRSPTLAFVEVKTRSQGNWDAEGLYAITRAKQMKLWKTAQCFLAEHSQWAEVACRFDVALVSGRRCADQTARRSPSAVADPASIQLGKPVLWEGHLLTLHTYLEAAFEGGI